MLKNVAAVAWPSTNSPNVTIFVRFKSNWEKIDKLKYDIGTEDVIIKDILDEKKSTLLPFIEDHLQVKILYSFLLMEIIIAELCFVSLTE